MKISSLTLLSLVASTSAFNNVPLHSSTTPITSTTQIDAKTTSNDDGTIISRRNMIFATGSTSLAFLLSNTQPANADLSLLNEFGGDPNKIEKKATPISSGPVVAKEKSESVIEPNLRSNYYYPTNKKRYLPRIKRCNDAIPDAANAIGEGNWETVDIFVNKIADDTILPLKLYTSSLTGGGTNVKVSFTKDMSKAANDFEKAQKALSKAVTKRDQTASSKGLEQLSSALQAYREAGRLTGPDAGGDIPSVDEIRRSACRVQGRTFEQKVKDRDARLAQEKMKTVASASN